MGPTLGQAAPSLGSSFNAINRNKGSCLQPSRADSFCSFTGFYGRRMRVRMHLSLFQRCSFPLWHRVLRHIYFSSLTGGEGVFLLPPVQLSFRTIQSFCHQEKQPYIHPVVILLSPLAHSWLPRLEAAPSVALSLNPARLNFSTWLHTPTFMAKHELQFWTTKTAAQQVLPALLKRAFRGLSFPRFSKSPSRESSDCREEFPPHFFYREVKLKRLSSRREKGTAVEIGWDESQSTVRRLFLVSLTAGMRVQMPTIT